MNAHRFCFWKESRRDSVAGLVREGLLDPHDAERILERMPPEAPAEPLVRPLKLCAWLLFGCGAALLMHADVVQKLLGYLPSAAAAGLLLAASMLFCFKARKKLQEDGSAGILMPLLACLLAAGAAAVMCDGAVWGETLWWLIAAGVCAAVPGRLGAWWAAGAVFCSLLGTPAGMAKFWDAGAMSAGCAAAGLAMSGRVDRRWLAPCMALFMACSIGAAGHEKSFVYPVIGFGFGILAMIRGAALHDAAMRWWGAAAVCALIVVEAAIHAGGSAAAGCVFLGCAAAAGLAARRLAARSEAWKREQRAGEGTGGADAMPEGRED